MLSTLALKKAGIQTLACARYMRLFSITPARHSAVTTVRESEVPLPGEEPRIVDAIYKEHYPSSANIPVTLEEKVYYWKKANDTFFGPERDFKNFPHPVFEEKVKDTYQLGFIPTRWFMHIYPQLGVSGCYTLFWGSMLFLVNKEYLLLDHELLEFLAVVLVLNFIRHRWGDKIRGRFELRVQERYKFLYVDQMKNATAGYISEVKDVKEEISQQDAVPIIFQAKQEQIELQLEAEYRKRLAEVYQTVRRRLEYKADLEHTQRSFEQDHMVNWIVNGVKAAITPQQEKENIASCIRTLKTMSATATL